LQGRRKCSDPVSAATSPTVRRSSGNSLPLTSTRAEGQTTTRKGLGRHILFNAASIAAPARWQKWNVDQTKEKAAMLARQERQQQLHSCFSSCFAVLF